MSPDSRIELLSLVLYLAEGWAYGPGNTCRHGRPKTVIMKTYILLSLVLLALVDSARAQQFPGAGSQLQQLPQAPVLPPALPDIHIQEAAAPAVPGAPAARVLIKVVHFAGNHVFLENKLLAVAGFVPGSPQSLADLQDMAARITAFYRNHGYFVARAYLKAQKITDNVVTISVQEGRYGTVTLRNTSNLSTRLAQRRLDGLNSGDPLTIDPLENRLLLLADTPGIVVASTLAPGALPGTSDLQVDVTTAPRVRQRGWR